MENQDKGEIAPTPEERVEKNADAAQIADAMIATWQEINTALTPIIGQRGVAALYKRSLHLTGQVHPWLGGMHEGVHTTMDLAALKSVLAQQSSANAIAGGDALLQKFQELLASLVGPLLTERLLRSVWAHSHGFSPGGGGQLAMISRDITP